MKNKRRYAGIVAALMLVLAVLASVPVMAYPSHTDFIADEATVIDETCENKIKELSETLLDEKNVRIALCTVLNTGSESAEEYAASVYEDWGVGHGVLILVSTEGDTFYAVQSNSIADVLTSDKLSDIINTTMEPRFAEKDYSGAVAAAADALSAFMKENLPDDIGEKKGGIPGWLSVILKIILVLAILAIAGYALLVYFERKRANEIRLAMEARRRRIMEEGRDYRRPNGQRPMQNGQRPMQNGQRPMQNGQRPMQNGQRPMQNGQRPMQNGQRPMQNGQRPMQNGQRPMQNGQMSRASMEMTGQYTPAANRRTAPQRFDDNAATVQISTADIRAVRGGRDKFSDSIRR
ncbi:MAG: TPM domain-containing protein [Clostridia bacterium]|nr:TPM domain-containing protein [Clostridia bacterium]